MRFCMALVLCIPMWIATSTTWGQAPQSRSRGLIGKAFAAVARGTNEEPSFMVRLAVNQKDHAYVEGENLVINVVSEQPGYLYLYLIQLVNGEEHCYVLYPNDFEASNKIAADTPVTIPSRNSYDLKCVPPLGPGRLFALVTKNELKSVQDVKRATKSGPAQATSEQIVATVQEVQQRDPAEFAEVYLDIDMFSNASERDQKYRKTRRVAVCIGISDYADSEINDLKVSHHDAEVMAQVLENQCQVEVLTLLVNEQASRAAIEKAIFEDLPASTQPGDTVFIFFSGHGGRCADTNDDEEDKYDEYLVPHDAKLVDVDTMILDDVFGRWMQQLEGRQVCIVLDNCHSGGATKNLARKNGRKGISSVTVDKAVDRVLAIDFFDGEMRRAKDLGQKGTVIVAACKPNQLAWEMNAPNQESVLTHFLLEAVAQKSKSDKNQDSILTVNEAFQFIEPSIKEYVRANMQTDQNPVLLDNTVAGAISLAP